MWATHFNPLSQHKTYVQSANNVVAFQTDLQFDTISVWDWIHPNDIQRLFMYDSTHDCISITHICPATHSNLKLNFDFDYLTTDPETTLKKAQSFH